MKGRQALRIAALLVALLFLGTFAPPSMAPALDPSGQALLSFEKLPLDASAPQRRRLGRLTYIEGWSIRSDDPRFGGISAMHVDRGRVLALSDTGSLLRFELPVGSDQSVVRIDPLPDGPGTIERKGDRDSESLLLFAGSAWVGFESRQEIWRYRLSDWRPMGHSAPAAMRKWPSNAGSEAMVRLPDGRFLVFSEGAKGAPGTSQALLFQDDPASPASEPVRLGYRPPAGYRITDAALLAGGQLLLLNRRFSAFEGLTAKLLIASVPDVAEGAIIEGKEIADLRAPTTVDNMEALSLAKENGRTIVWMASDDNFFPLQRTLLMKFALADRP